MLLRSVSLFLALSPAMLWATLASASITVEPGPGTPIQDAINAAPAGETINLVNGDYSECLVIDKPITLRNQRSTASSSTSDDREGRRMDTSAAIRDRASRDSV